MRLLLAATIAAVTLVGPVQAADRMTDAQYTQMGRCAGLAAAAGQDATPMTQALRDDRAGRRGTVLSRAQSNRQNARLEFQRANAEGRARLTAELAQGCAA